MQKEIESYRNLYLWCFEIKWVGKGNKALGGLKLGVNE